MHSVTKRRCDDSPTSSSQPVAGNSQSSQLTTQNKQLEKLRISLETSAENTSKALLRLATISDRFNAKGLHEGLTEMRDHIWNLKQKPTKEPFPLKTISLEFTIGSTGSEGCSRRIEKDGSSWMFRVENTRNFLSLHLLLLEMKNNAEWTAICSFTLHSHEGNLTRYTDRVHIQDGCEPIGFASFMEWEEFDKLKGIVRLKVEISVMEDTSVPRTRFRRFDQTQRMWADVKLTVKGECFYVLKSMLAARCSSFDLIFESGRDEYEVDDVEPEQFLEFLKYIYGEITISGTNVENLIHLAKCFDAPTIIADCKRFLNSHKSDINPVEKFRLAIQNGFVTAVDVSIDQMENIDQIREALTLNQQFPTTTAVCNALTNKSILLYDQLEQFHSNSIN